MFNNNDNNNNNNNSNNNNYDNDNDNNNSSNGNSNSNNDSNNNNNNNNNNLYYDYEKYLLSPLKPRFLVLIEQYLPNICDPVYSVLQSFVWFLWLNWSKSTFYRVTAPNDSKCWPIVTSSIQEPVASNCDVTMTDCSRAVAMNAFLAQWNRKFITAQWSTENTSCFNFFVSVFF